MNTIMTNADREAERLKNVLDYELRAAYASMFRIHATGNLELLHQARARIVMVLMREGLMNEDGTDTRDAAEP